MPGLEITDVCLVTRDLDAAVEFYTTKLGYRMAHKSPGFVDFVRSGSTLAVWEASAIRRTTGVPAEEGEPGGHGVMIAILQPSPEAVDAEYERLRSAGVEFYSEPRDYPWNARCAYFAGPCGEFWELFAWYEGGEPDAVDSDE